MSECKWMLAHAEWLSENLQQCWNCTNASDQLSSQQELAEKDGIHFFTNILLSDECLASQNIRAYYSNIKIFVNKLFHQGSIMEEANFPIKMTINTKRRTMSSSDMTGYDHAFSEETICIVVINENWSPFKKLYDLYLQM